MAGIDAPSTTGRAVHSIAFHLPAIPDIDGFLDDAREILRSGRLSQGPYVARLEKDLSLWLGGRDVVAVSNCSDALIAGLSLVAEPGCEVIIPAFTYLATWQSVRWARMTPVVVDVDERGLIDVDAVAAAITPRTGAILAVHLAGSLAPMARLAPLAAGHGIALVADGAHALGATAGDVMAGSLGDVEAFSLGATKQVAAGEGGCLTVRDPARTPAVRRWALQGHEPGEMDAVGPGMNLRLAELTAALAIRQLAGLDGQLTRRAVIHARYADACRDLPLRLSGQIDGERSALKDQLVWVDDPADRAGLRAHLATRGVETKPYYERAIPDLTVFEGRIHSTDRARDLASRSFAIPIHARLSDDDVDHIGDSMRSFFGAP